MLIYFNLPANSLKLSSQASPMPNNTQPQPSYTVLTKDITQAITFIAAGRVVAFPTGTSYGLAADATQGYALQRLRILKGRIQEQSFTIMLKNTLWPEYLALSPREKTFLSHTAGQHLTVLVKPKPLLSHLAVDGLIGLRLIDHPQMDQLCRAASVPLTATSANHTGDTPCHSPACIQTAFPGLVPDKELNENEPRGASGTTYNLSLAAILDGGTLSPSRPTTIIRLSDKGGFTIIRPGAVTKDELNNMVTL